MSYDPRAAYYERMTPAARRGNARRAASAHENIGGHDSNYRDNLSSNSFNSSSSKSVKDK